VPTERRIKRAKNIIKSLGKLIATKTKIRIYQIWSIALSINSYVFWLKVWLQAKSASKVSRKTDKKTEATG
jgi:hypothetical protein